MGTRIGILTMLLMLPLGVTFGEVSFYSNGRGGTGTTFTPNNSNRSVYRDSDGNSGFILTPGTGKFSFSFDFTGNTAAITRPGTGSISNYRDSRGSTGYILTPKDSRNSFFHLDSLNSESTSGIILSPTPGILVAPNTRPFPSVPKVPALPVSPESNP